jgi:antirestriction protein
MTTATATATRPAGIAAYLPDVGAYIACLASYNNGRLHGAWVDLEVAATLEEVQECIDWVIATSPTPGAEEYAVHDWSGVPRSISGKEWPDWEEALTLLGAIDGHGEAFQLWHENAPDYNTEPSAFERDYVGRYESGADYARDYFEERHGDALEQLQDVTFAIDWEAVWERGDISQYFWGSQGAEGFHVYRSC